MSAMFRKKKGRSPADRPSAPSRPLTPAQDLERRILELILEFPDRIDEMETRNEENCRALAARLAGLAEEEIARRLDAS